MNTIFLLCLLLMSLSVLAKTRIIQCDDKYPNNPARNMALCRLTIRYARNHVVGDYKVMAPKSMGLSKPVVTSKPKFSTPGLPSKISPNISKCSIPDGKQVVCDNVLYARVE